MGVTNNLLTGMILQEGGVQVERTRSKTRNGHIWRFLHPANQLNPTFLFGVFTVHLFGWQESIGISGLIVTRWARKWNLCLLEGWTSLRGTFYSSLNHVGPETPIGVYVGQKISDFLSFLVDVHRKIPFAIPKKQGFFLDVWTLVLVLISFFQGYHPKSFT